MHTQNKVSFQPIARDNCENSSFFKPCFYQYVFLVDIYLHIFNGNIAVQIVVSILMYQKHLFLSLHIVLHHYFFIVV